MLYQKTIIYYHFFCKDHHYHTFLPGYKCAIYALLEIRPLTLTPNKYRDWFKISNLQYFS